jgi:hypothetical protein
MNTMTHTATTTTTTKTFIVAFHDWQGNRHEVQVKASDKTSAYDAAWKWIEENRGDQLEIEFAGVQEIVYLKDIIAKALAEN